MSAVCARSRRASCALLLASIALAPAPARTAAEAPSAAGSASIARHSPGLATRAPGPTAALIAPKIAADEGFVGGAACAPCHEKQTELWRGSHHDLAMAVADETTVLGRFDGSELTHFGVTSRMFRRGDEYVVRTDGPDGAMRDYEIAYVFGVYPLQQYLVAFPGGRFQALPLAWDARPAALGGQRWFHLYPDERLPAGDALHWTGPNQNWNFMCADCHSTVLKRGYHADRDVFETTFSEIDVSCEACHGPGARHVEWARRAKGKDDPGTGDGAHEGLVVDLTPRSERPWKLEEGASIAHPGWDAGKGAGAEAAAEIEVCAPCHARRAAIGQHVPGQSFLAAHRPSFLDEGLYAADGQIQEEVYEYGSFLQSRMFHAGVACSDCHDPHSLKLRADGNALCAQCHRPTVFDTPAHTHHPAGSPGAQCVACHMPTRTYMVVDVRRDHSLRVPRPDLSVSLGVPNPCSSCHADRSAAWAAEQVAKWSAARAPRPRHYGEVLHAGRRGKGSSGDLARLARDAASPPIVRASALSLLWRYPGQTSEQAIEAGSKDGDALVRLAAASAAESLPPPARARILPALLADPARAVRIEAARQLVAARDELSPSQREAFARALAEYREAQLATADRAGSRVNLGALEAELGDYGKAEAQYRAAIRLEPYYTPAYVNLADLYRLQSRDADGERVLRDGIARVPSDGHLQHSLGLLLVRAKRLPEALDALERAVELAPESPRYAYVLAVALQQSGNPQRALEILKAAHARQPADRDVLQTLAVMSAQSGDLEGALEYARALTVLAPDDPRAMQLFDTLDAERRSR